MSDAKGLLIEIKDICDTLSQDIEKHLDSKAISEVTATIELLQGKLNSYLIDSA